MPSSGGARLTQRTRSRRPRDCTIEMWKIHAGIVLFVYYAHAHMCGYGIMFIVRERERVHCIFLQYWWAVLAKRGPSMWVCVCLCLCSSLRRARDPAHRYDVLVYVLWKLQAFKPPNEHIQCDTTGTPFTYVHIRVRSLDRINANVDDDTWIVHDVFYGSHTTGEIPAPNGKLTVFSSDFCQQFVVCIWRAFLCGHTRHSQKCCQRMRVHFRMHECVYLCVHSPIRTGAIRLVLSVCARARSQVNACVARGLVFMNFLREAAF